MREIQLLASNVDGNRIDYQYRASEEISGYFKEKSMFIEYTSSVESVPKSLLAIPFVANVLPIIWMTDSTLWIEEIDRTFYECLLRLKSAFQDLYPTAKLRGRVVAAKLIENTYNPTREALLLFSGGIDAHVSYLRLREEKPLLLNIQGWFKSIKDEKQDNIAEADKKDIQGFAQQEGVEFEFVKSNFATFINDTLFNKRFHKKVGDSLWHGVQHAMNFITIAMPIAYLRGIHSIYIASSFSLGHVGKCASYPTTDNEYRFAQNGRCVHDAFELSRQDKVHYLVEYQKKIQKPYPVRVCSFNTINCCECDKCFRSILEIIAENGDIKNFGFNIQGSLKDYYENLMERKIIQFGIAGESRKHWPDTIARMKQNYDILEQKEFVDWFLQYDFVKKRRSALQNYYRKNLFSILKRKIFRN